MMKNNRGFTFAEMLIATLVMAGLMGAVLTIFSQSQNSYTSQKELNQATQELRIVMDQIVRYLRQAGSDPQGTLALVPLQIIDAGHIQVSSDITGSVASTTGNPKESTGDPDGTLDSIYEVVVLRHDPQTETLYIDIGYGEQVLAEGISNLTFTFFDLDGNVTVNPGSIVRARVEVTRESDHVDLQSGNTSTVTLASEVFIRSQTQEIFAE